MMDPENWDRDASLKGSGVGGGALTRLPNLLTEGRPSSPNFKRACLLVANALDESMCFWTLGINNSLNCHQRAGMPGPLMSRGGQLKEARRDEGG